jgi:hypothetical protein
MILTELIMEIAKSEDEVMAKGVELIHEKLKYF